MRSDAEGRSSGLPLSRWLLLSTLTGVALFATGVGSRPDGAVWTVVYDLVLYNAVYLGGVLTCLSAVWRGPADRLAWASLAVAILLGVIGNLVYTLAVATMDP